MREPYAFRAGSASRTHAEAEEHRAEREEKALAKERAKRVEHDYLLWEESLDAIEKETRFPPRKGSINVWEYKFLRALIRRTNSRTRVAEPNSNGESLPVELANLAKLRRQTVFDMLNSFGPAKGEDLKPHHILIRHTIKPRQELKSGRRLMHGGVCIELLWTSTKELVKRLRLRDGSLACVGVPHRRESHTDGSPTQTGVPHRRDELYLRLSISDPCDLPHQKPTPGASPIEAAAPAAPGLTAQAAPAGIERHALRAGVTRQRSTPPREPETPEKSGQKSGGREPRVDAGSASGEGLVGVAIAAFIEFFRVPPEHRSTLVHVGPRTRRVIESCTREQLIQAAWGAARAAAEGRRGYPKTLRRVFGTADRVQEWLAVARDGGYRASSDSPPGSGPSEVRPAVPGAEPRTGVHGVLPRARNVHTPELQARISASGETGGLAQPDWDAVERKFPR